MVGRMLLPIYGVFSAVGGDASFGLPGALKDAAHMPGTGLVSADEVRQFQALTADETVHYAPPMMATAWGQRPA